MRFSEHFGITPGKKDDWFDPHLTVDTKLFVDPLLLLKKGTTGVWRGAHDELIAHFVFCYGLIAKSTSRTSSMAEHARRLLVFPEPSEFCLGYTARGTRGSGGGGVLAGQIAGGIAVAIAAGLTNPQHIEELGILNEGIGADRISDATCNVLKGRFVRYTQAVAKRHGVQMEPHRLRNAAVYLEEGRWVPETVDLPTNPTNGKPILLVPERFLNDLPVLNADDWFDSHLNADVRAQMNMTMSQRARKEDIVRWARQHPERVRAWARQEASREVLSGYDFGDDPKGVVGWDTAGRLAAAAHPIVGLKAVETQEDLRKLLLEALKNFKHFVEDQRGWSLLWDTAKDKPKPEEAIQLLFLGMAQHYFRMFGVELDREVELGRGPVDFKLSKGTPVRLVLEMKKDTSGAFWNGLDNQLATYMKGDNSAEGWFIAIRFSETKAGSDKIDALPRRVREASARCGAHVGYFVIDARKKDSASKPPKAGES